MMLLLDLDDTLTDAAPGFCSWVRQWVTRFDEEQREAMTAYLTGPELRPLYPHERLAAFRERFGVRDTAVELHADYIAQAAEHTHLVDGALDALARAREAGWPLGIVTNGPGDLQRAKLDHLALEHHVDAVVISGEVGVAKPDPAIFALAATRLGDPGSPGWMVGDNPVADIGGAHASGLRSVWLRHGRTWDPADGTPGEQANTLPEAIELVLREREDASA